jgi:dipeptidyl aminopeptidase/acylaminoacyl peptidase
MRVVESHYYDISTAESPRLSPDATTVAYVCKQPKDEESYEAMIHVVSTESGQSRRFTLTGNVDDEPTWSPSGDRLAFVSDRDGDSPQLWVMPTDGGEARRVTDVVGDVSDITWSPDGKRIAFVQQATVEERAAGHDIEVDEEYEREEPDPRVVRRLVYRAHQEYFDGRRSHIYIADLSDDGTDEVTRVTDGEYDFENPEWGDAETLYYTVQRDGDPDDNLIHDIIANDRSTGESETITQTTGWLPTFSATEDGKVAYRYSPNDEPGPSMRKTEVRVLDTKTGEKTTPTSEFDHRVYRGSTPQWGPDGDLYFLFPDEGAVKLARVAPDGTEQPTAVLDGDKHIRSVHVTDSGFAFTASEWDHPPDVYVSDPSGEAERLTDVNEAYLTQRYLSRPEKVRFESADGTEVQGWVLTPPEFDPDETYPLVVEIHGGPSVMWTRSGTMWHEFQLLAAKGYVVFWCNPRGSTGYGEDHTLAIAGDWGGPDFEDIMAGVEEVSGRTYVDEDRLFVTGGSFGGFMTAWTIGHTDRFRAAVAQRGVYDQIAQFGATDTYHSSEKQLGRPWDDPERYWEASPIAHVADADTPTLIVHSENDFRVPIHNAEVLYRFLRKNDVESEFVRYPREGHELSRSGEPAHVVDRLERIVNWFGDHGGVSAARSDDGEADY